MINSNNPLGITDVVLRDAHQSLFATRLRIDDMLPIAEKLDRVGFWSLETWGGATFDACIRYLGEDPWDRIRELKKAMPNTPQQMLLRGQNLLGYRHYADDVVETFVERAAANGVDVFRVFDAMNDMRNIETAMKAVKRVGKHAQGTLSYTTSQVHTLDGWIAQAKQIEDMGADSICIKDMAGLLKPYDGYKLVKRLKEECDIPIHMQCHATTGLAHATILKCVEAGIDNVDTAISSMSMTYGHSPTETLVATLEGTNRATGLDLILLEEIAAYFREVRKKYAKFEGSLKGVDARILIAQVPGGMLTNMESQLREQNALDRFDDVLAEIPRVREDLGFIPLVTPTSQIVGTQSVINVLSGARYKTISRETAGVLRGEYGSTPAPVNPELQARVLEDGELPVTCRPADNLAPELEQLTLTLEKEATERKIRLHNGDQQIDDVLTYALFPQVGLKFLANRDNPAAFEPVPTGRETGVPTNDSGDEVYTVELEGRQYTVTVSNGGDLTGIVPISGSHASTHKASGGASTPINAPLAGNIVKVFVKEGDVVAEGEPLLLLEAMKMETQVSAPAAGVVRSVDVKTGDAVTVSQQLLTLA
ncbi:sodium-extruding oxaloacetate decarboxylase subunit alpha [Cellvibrio japonicus]|uniref:Oxaloacetate decarboxylase alpha subunit n=1 Tax=Cellvibrio japonicus (strain Ueda107) TaxID=498211 RepID=B3PBJ0_CELJU|nr:sodium-extruding oxaloacetate decarboxylase subunit alpha [Cellvibrio japonicus]ACE85570.1 oxaloacetate decarboxylase alpha subunit [Cellvibrio japonicus Ueda107]QEI13104.1 oxaloacetate decarboxylase subunit alpha [Cellvibrio japonicus]QEI16678.1 oxaloacetate decarboxylase subunit alpha [Cellvibrio japonicus]QEI20256.1 oxaloacetate decarboxylase subunit alpha [Cellvibrio japonicus]